MKKRMIIITAFMAVALAGCGEIDEPLTTTNSNNQAAAQIEVQTESKTDASAESTTETQTTAKASTETTSDVSATEIQAEGNAVNAISENNDSPQPQADKKRSATESEKPDATTASTTQVVTTQAETTNAPVAADNGQSVDVFKMLDSLNYHAISCDGLPEYQLTASNGTIYLLNISSNWVWRRPSLIADADNEAPLTKEVIDAIYANWNQLNIVETGW